MDSITQRRPGEGFTGQPSAESLVEGDIPSKAAPPNSGCVHFEHAGPVAVDGVERSENPAMMPLTMSSYRLLVCLAILGWSERDVARRTGRHQTTIVRWAKGLSPVPDEEAAWLETLTAFHVANPAPRKNRKMQPIERHIPLKLVMR